MTSISLKVNGASVVASVNGKITSGMVGIPVNIEYDNSWEGLTKTAVFRVGYFERDRKNIGTTTTVPWEVLRNSGKPLEIGIEGKNEDGSVIIPTIWATVSTILPGANSSIPGAPNPENGDSAGGEYAIIDDSQTSPNTTWSSQKIAEELASSGGGEGGGSYKLPIATPETLGGVKPTLKTDEMTQSVGVDEMGGLWTTPSEGGGSVALDTTLTQAGVAADAKAVGDKLGVIETALDTIIAIQNELIGGDAE